MAFIYEPKGIVVFSLQIYKLDLKDKGFTDKEIEEMIG